MKAVACSKGPSNGSEPRPVIHRPSSRLADVKFGARFHTLRVPATRREKLSKSEVKAVKEQGMIDAAQYEYYVVGHQFVMHL